MGKAARFLVSGLSLGLCALSTPAASLPTLGSRVPQLQLEPVDGPPRPLTCGGRPTLIFYESKDSRAQNWPIKKRLKELVTESAEYREKVALFAVADLEGYDFWPVRGFAADAVRSEAKRIGESIYCDWKGLLGKALGLHREKSSVILVDPEGKVVFAAEGPLTEETQDQLLALLQDELS